MTEYIGPVTMIQTLPLFSECAMVAAIASAGATLRFLPAYSPELSPH
jgi:hypothetical protein